MGLGWLAIPHINAFAGCLPSCPALPSACQTLELPPPSACPALLPGCLYAQNCLHPLPALPSACLPALQELTEADAEKLAALLEARLGKRFADIELEDMTAEVTQEVRKECVCLWRLREGLGLALGRGNGWVMTWLGCTVPPSALPLPSGAPPPRPPPPNHPRTT